MTNIDRNARNHVAAEIRRFLAGETIAFEFDDAIFDIDSDDSTVNAVVRMLCCHYDDLKDHSTTVSVGGGDRTSRIRCGDG